MQMHSGTDAGEGSRRVRGNLSRQTWHARIEESSRRGDAICLRGARQKGRLRITRGIRSATRAGHARIDDAISTHTLHSLLESAVGLLAVENRVLLLQDAIEHNTDRSVASWPRQKLSAACSMQHAERAQTAHVRVLTHNQTAQAVMQSSTPARKSTGARGRSVKGARRRREFSGSRTKRLAMGHLERLQVRALAQQ